mgnify:CR=1 FL=1
MGKHTVRRSILAKVFANMLYGVLNHTVNGYGANRYSR